MSLIGLCKLLYDFTAENDSELSVTEGSVVNVVEAREDGWVLVELDSKVGLVPESYVERIIESPSDRKKRSSAASSPNEDARSPDIDADGESHKDTKDKSRDKDKDKERRKNKDKDRARDKDREKTRSDTSRDKEKESPKERERDKDKDKQRRTKDSDKAERVSRRKSGELKSPDASASRGSGDSVKSPSSRFKTMSSSRMKQELAALELEQSTVEAPTVLEAEPASSIAVSGVSEQEFRAPNSTSVESPPSKRPLPSIPKRSTSAMIPKLPPKIPRPAAARDSPPPVPAKTVKKADAPNSPGGVDSPSDSPIMRSPSSGHLVRSTSTRSITRQDSMKTTPPLDLGPFISDPERDQQRAFIIKELVNTEKTYVAGLKEAIDKFYKPLLQVAQSKTEPLLTVEDLRLIFSQLENLLPLNQNLLQKLEERMANWTPTQLIGDVFVKFGPFLKMYTTYSNTYDSAVETLERISKSSSFIQICEKKSNVENLIITPIQRIPRYTLLLTDLLRKTPKEHPDYFDIDKALSTSKEVAEHVNKSIDTYKNVSRLTEAGLSHLLAPHRYLVREGAVTIVTPESPGRERKTGLLSGVVGKQKRPTVHFLLFNDMLAVIDGELDENLMSKKTGKPLVGGKKGKGSKDYQWPLFLLWLRDIGIKTGFELSGPNKTLACYFDSPDSKDEWWKTFSELIRASLMQQPGNEIEVFPPDVAITMLERHGKHRFFSGDTYEGWWLSGKIHGEGKFECFGTFFEGTFDASYKNGSGKITYLNGQVYTGSWRLGRPVGTGSITWPDGSKFDGEFKDGKKTGKGIMTYPNGDFYDGEWKSDVPHGHGKMHFKNVLEYDGSFQDGKFQGSGCLKVASGSYDGSFERGVRTGRGCFTFKDGSKYEGEWKEDRQQGMGKMVYADGSSYDGEWMKGLREGKGSFVSDSSTYDGSWKADRPDGTGVWTSPSGVMRRYEGDFLQGRKTGRGTAIYASGDKYQGEFLDDLPHGAGKMTFANGALLEGRWMFGVKDGKVTFTTAASVATTLDLKEEEGAMSHIDPPAAPFFDLSQGFFG